MNNAEKFLLHMSFFLIIVILGIMINGHFNSCDSIGRRYMELLFENTMKEASLEACRRYNPFQAAVTKIGNRPYSEEYDCVDHAKDLQKELAKVDISSSIFINDGRDHAWLGVWIETVNGRFIGIENDLSILEVKNSDMQNFYRTREDSFNSSTRCSRYLES